MSRLTPNQKITLQNKLNDKWRYRYLYGDEYETLGIKPCIKVKNGNETVNNPFFRYQDNTDQSHQYYGSKLKCYQISYMISINRRPNGQIGHYCGNIYNTKSTTCIEPSHMNHRNEPQNINNQRRRCHDKIAYWEIQTRKSRSYKIKGPLYLSFIQTKEQQKRQNGSKLASRIGYKDDDGDQEMDNQQQDDNFDDYYICEHNPHCFINCSKIGYVYIRSNSTS